MSDITNILNKYKSSKSPKNTTNKNAFIGLSGGYNPKEIDKELDDFNTEYHKQKITAEKFTNNEDLLEKCHLFSKDYSTKVEEQSRELELLVKELPNIIKYNKEQSEINVEMSELISSPEYVELTNKLRGIKTNIAKIKNFLLKEGIHDF